MRPPTPAQIAKARYDEAHAIKDAWNHRLVTAQAEHYKATRNNGDALTTKRQLAATEIEHQDAVEQCRIAQQTWINESNRALWPNRKTA